ncbi:hypothetical protein PghCCS26_16580 [Paenibacillus glycanilyticus]|uniref:DUF6843 domain-containing protein n=1 Tax=Paenibacillus glycanilyticus TaxID=126569 RepID=A0ABQ6NJ22_9BACL|nr:hypothetical protein [Paenibacillus glycanilyticus]GMK44530.1 hypothetical protein PghCCS26_16580 [Paenibacillus glycanilyticus]
MNRNVITALFGLVAMLWTLGFIVIHPYSPSSTNDIYLIPEGYEGDIRVNYNVQGAPILLKEGKYDVIPVGIDGIFNTSKPEMEYGLVTDLYFYVNAAGERTPIDKLCVCVKGNGSSEIGSTVTRHTDLAITRTKCGEDFMAWGK